MRYRGLLITLIFIAAFGLPALSLYAQEESVGSDIPPETTSGGTAEPNTAAEQNSPPDTGIPAQSAGTLEAATTSASTGRPNTLSPSPTPASSATVVPAAVESIATTTAASAKPTTPESSNFIIYLAGFTVLAVSLGTYTILKKIKFPNASSNTSQGSLNDPCSTIQKELTEKKTALTGAGKSISIQELLLEKAISKLKEKEAAIKKDIEAKAKDVLLGKKDSTEARRAFDAAEKAKKEFDQAKEDVEKIQKAIEDLRNLGKKLADEVGTLEAAYATCTAGLSAASALGVVGTRIPIPQFTNGKLALVSAAEKDIATLITIEKSVAGGKTYSAMVEEGEWKEVIANEKVFLVQDEGKDIGDVSYEIRGDEIYISGLALIPSFQGKGIGKQVLEILLVCDDFKNAKKISLVTHPENDPAIKLYTSLGFAKGEQHENYFGDGEPRIELIRTQ